MKQCPRCKTLKPFTEFGKNKATSDGYRWECKACQREYDLRFRTKNAKKRSEQNRKWRIANPEKNYERKRRWDLLNRDKKRQKDCRYRSDYKEKVSEAKRVWYLKNTEKITEKNRKYRAEHREKMNEYASNYRAKKKGDNGKITAKEWMTMKRLYGFMCLCCGRKEPEIKLELDHVIPLSLGGPNTIDNAQPLCKSCNSSKQAKSIDYRKFYNAERRQAESVAR